MKKSLLLLCGTCFVAAASAQTQKLVSIIADDEMESETFTYDDENRLVSYLHLEDFGDGINYLETYTYNELGQIVEDATQQDMGESNNPADWRLVTKCTYTYNAQGLLATRDNFNSFGGALEQSAHIWYDYDAQGRLIKESQAWAYKPDSPFMIVEYNYDEQGRLLSTIESSEDWYNPGSFEESGMLENTYNEQGLLASSKYYYLGFGDPWLAENNVYTYDEAGNIIQGETLTASGDLKSRSVYTYDTSVPASDLILPETHEFELHHSFGINNMRTSEEVWMGNDWEDEPVLAYTLVYGYEQTTTVGLRHVAETAGMTFDADSKTLTVLSGRGAASVRVMNQSGQTIMIANTQQGRADLSSLAAGIYVVSVKCPGMAAQHQKLVIR